MSQLIQTSQIWYPLSGANYDVQVVGVADGRVVYIDNKNKSTHSRVIESFVEIYYNPDLLDHDT